MPTVATAPDAEFTVVPVVPTPPSSPNSVMPLALWRTRVPDSSSSAEAERLAFALLTRARAASMGLRVEELELIARAEAGDPDAWLLLSDVIVSLTLTAEVGGYGGEVDDDLVGSCLWLAARGGRLWAYVLLSDRLARLPLHELSDAEARERLRLVAYAALEYTLQADPYFAARGLGILEPISRQVIENIAKVEVPRPKPTIELEFNGEDEEDSSTGPAMRVLATPPPLPAGREDKALVERYAVLAKYTPLAPLPDADTVAAVLAAEFPWMADIIDVIHSDLALAARCGAEHARLAPMLLVGPAGVGKSRFARRLGDALSLPIGWINAGGSSDNRALAGTARGWGTLSPCLPLTVMLQHRAGNPLLVVDEIDKVATSSQNGNIVDTLLTMTEPVTATAWQDDCLLVAADLSQVTWVLLANRADLVHPLLRSRCRVLTVGAPRPQDFDVLLAGVLADIAAGFAAKPTALPMLEPEIVDALRRSFAQGHLQARQLAGLVRRALAAAATAERRLTRH